MAPGPQYVPASQSSQLAPPLLAWYFPAAHLAHGTVGSAENRPLSHGVGALLPAGQCVPAAHGAGFRVPCWVQWKPAGHGLSATDPGGQNEPARHSSAAVALTQYLANGSKTRLSPNELWGSF